MQRKWFKQLMVIAVLLLLVLAVASAKAGLEDDVKKLARGNNRFAIELYKQLQQREGNIFCSPHSVSMALGMALEGANGATAKQMRETLHLKLAHSQFPPAVAALDKMLADKSSTTNYQLLTANSLWGQKGHPFLKPFLETLNTYYGAGLRRTDFRKDTEGARKVINAWVARKTQEKITDLLSPGVLTPTTRLVLCNAIYFRGNWADRFDEEQTENEPFLCSDGQKTQVAMMHKQAETLYTETEHFQAIELPYEGRDLSMVVFLPKENSGLSEMETEMDCSLIRLATDNMNTHEVQISLPRFKIKSNFSLGQTLISMGMPLAFSSEADFSGMDGMRDLFIGAVIHQAYVEVNEKGTEAAAATATTMLTSAIPQKPVRFIANHPFVFIIRDNRSDSILFAGRVSKP